MRKTQFIEGMKKTLFVRTTLGLMKSKNTLSAQITLETAIVMPIVIMTMVICICLSLYLHDMIALKSYAYAAAIEHNGDQVAALEQHVRARLQSAPLFLTKWSMSCTETVGSYQINIVVYGNSSIRMMNTLINEGGNSQTITVEKRLSSDIMYAGRALCDEMNREGK